MKQEKRKRLEAAGWTVGNARDFLEGSTHVEPPSVTMTIEAQKVLNDALSLPANDRAQLAAELLTSLDAVEADVEAAWAVEIARRAADARENPDDEDDWRVALAEVQREVLSR